MSDGVNAELPFQHLCLQMGSTSNLVLYFLLTNRYVTTSLILKLVLQDFCPWGFIRLPFDVLLPFDKSLVISLGKTEILSCAWMLVSVWFLPYAMSTD